MSALEYRCNKLAAIIIPSVLFGLLHIIGNDLDLISTIQLIIAGSVVGLLFSLVTYESGNIWNIALIHGIWNMMIIGGIIHIGGAPDEFSLFNYVLNTDSFIITGGDFGMEASLISYRLFHLDCPVIPADQKAEGINTLFQINETMPALIHGMVFCIMERKCKWTFNFMKLFIYS